MDIQKIMGRPPSGKNGTAALTWAREQASRVLRGDLMIGIMDEEEYAAIVPALDYAARCGVPGAWRALADFHLLEGREGEAAAALQRALPSDPSATVELARVQWFHLHEQVTQQEAATTRHALQQFCADHPQDAEALYLLGLLTWGGFGQPADQMPADQVAAAQVEGAGLLRRAAELHSADAQFELYVLYSTGQGVQPDGAAARQFLEEAAAQGQPRALYNMGALHATGQGGFPRDLERAVLWYTRAAHNGHAQAARTLATMFLLGAGPEADAARGREFLELAEDLGEDMDDLRDFLSDGESPEDNPTADG